MTCASVWTMRELFADTLHSQLSAVACSTVASDEKLGRSLGSGNKANLGDRGTILWLRLAATSV